MFIFDSLREDCWLASINLMIKIMTDLMEDFSVNGVGQRCKF